MHRHVILFLGILLAVLTAGCAPLMEGAKVIWGSSTRALEQARADALRKTFRCELDACMDTVVQLTREDLEVVPVKAKAFTLFIEERVKAYLVVLDVPESVDTTEVGIFFTRQAEGNVQVEISSLSRNAKRAVAEIVFKELAKYYPVTGE